MKAPWGCLGVVAGAEGCTLGPFFVAKDVPVSDLALRGRELMNMASHLEEMLKYFNNGWAEFEKEFFEILLSSNYRPKVVALTGKKTHYFAIEYEQRKLVEREKPHLICDIESTGLFGKLIDSDGTMGAEADGSPEEGDDNERDSANYDVE